MFSSSGDSNYSFMSWFMVPVMPILSRLRIERIEDIAILNVLAREGEGEGGVVTHLDDGGGGVSARQGECVHVEGEPVGGIVSGEALGPRWFRLSTGIDPTYRGPASLEAV